MSDQARRMRFKAGRETPRAVALLIVVVIFSLAIGPKEFLGFGNVRGVLFAVSLIIIVVVGQTAVMLTRNLDLSVGATLAFTGYLSASMTASHPDLPLMAVLILAVGVGAVFGAFNGALVAWAGLPSIIVTLATLSIFRGLMFVVSGGDRASAGDGLTALGVREIIGVPVVAWLALAVAVVIAFILRRSESGRDLYAVGDNPDSARLVSIPVTRRVAAAFVLSGALSGLAGFLYAGLYAGVQQDSALGVEFAVVTAAVIGGVSVFGGVGTVTGAVLGAMIVGVVNNGLTLLNFDPASQTVFQGVAIIAVVTGDALVLRTAERRALVARRQSRRRPKREPNFAVPAGRNPA